MSIYKKVENLLISTKTGVVRNEENERIGKIDLDNVHIDNIRTLEDIKRAFRHQEKNINGMYDKTFLNNKI